eukprot:CAMPEP_0204333102 /NCGR_PEP_ID=MMETSP0469-20131031/16957_1 /ASSEMBLY_ACC=CAM_ASM_000384 /TAXON_ID=2969 /ORGANISM="Oxyrrhis marina" /LENGTH=58 /DNA_ID=CAMNT_0051316375 /DNA_START=1 /DNA_END=174 /DNA_ORIENTATION=+
MPCSGQGCGRPWAAHHHGHQTDRIPGRPGTRGGANGRAEAPARPAKSAATRGRAPLAA